MTVSEPRTGAEDAHPRAFEPTVLVVTVALSVVGAIIGLHLITTLGISANTSVIGALIAMIIGRVNVAALRGMRSVHRQNLVQSAVSGSTFAAANSLLAPIAVLFAFGRPDLVWPVFAGVAIGLFADSFVLYRLFHSRLLPAQAAWPPGVAAAGTIIAGDEGGRRAAVLAGGAAVGFVGSLFTLPVSAAGVAFLGNLWALAMLGLGLLVGQYGPDWFGVDIGDLYIPHGVMIGAGLVALGQAVHLMFRRRGGGAERTGEADPSQRPQVDERALRRGVLEGYGLFVLGAAVVALAGGLLAELSVPALVLWVLAAALAAIVHEIIVGLAAMHSGWFPAFAVTLIFLVLALLLRLPPVAVALFVGYTSATGPAFADMGYDLKAGWLLRRGHRPYDAFERSGRFQQYLAALVGFAVATVAVAVCWQSYFGEGLVPPTAKVYATSIHAGLTDPHLVVTLLLWAVPGALVQLLGGPSRQMGVLLATGLLVGTPQACWLVFGALLVRVVYRRWRGGRAEEELNLVGAGLIAGDALHATSRVFEAE
ncbi:OPT/YSL family transporter [Saccharopolyspora hordei]|uniref:Putative oligopeptide transporter (OPT) family protein n=1 Tax=Saccharopolyspora hordei TaxID=1838 RepID=A0A853AKE7_9PSEU|nr:OPT/YSL family transporter [Saccharopolyspora hordei]NYI85172.1 putative oligopeptide transporter (OPT) family protein [Saccharopolyspora hordei]